MTPTAPHQLLTYPPAPALTNTQFLDPSSVFRQQVRRTLTGIIGFAALYLVLVAFGLALGYGCVIGTIALISFSVNKFTLLIGLGLLALAVMFLLFLVKFLFAVHTNKNDQRIEITAEDHPRLFAFIDQLTDEVASPKPHKIYLSPNVNASVFYSSSFWSLFFPVRKNLEIGLGLVNSINMSEFKAVMAHEFGHFSQRSMKLGSYVYIVNRVIYNLVYDRDRWDELLDRWAASGGVWGIFAKLTHLLVNVVRKILSKAYEWLNLRYMGLSREMEYQADMVAVSAAGNQPIITALRRIEFGDAAYNRMLTHLSSLIDESKVARNLYALHTETLSLVAAENEIVMERGLPVLDDHQTAKMASPNRVNYQDQWSSHPSQAEREANARSVVAPCDLDESSPWSLFNNPQQWQQKLTANIYAGVDLANTATRQFIEANDYATYVTDQAQRAQLPEAYRGFYDRRLLWSFDPVKQAKQTTPIPSAETLFSEENRSLRKQLFVNFDDRDTLEQIKAKQIQTRTFDFDGQKYDRRDAAIVLDNLNREITAQQAYFQKLEEDAFRWHYQRAVRQGLANELIERYQLYFRIDADRETYTDWLQQYGVLVQTVYEFVKDGITLRASVTEQIDSLNQTLQQAYADSQAIVIPQHIGNHDFPDGYAAYLCPDGLKTVHGEPFVWDDMMTQYQQLEQMPSRATQVQIALLDDLIRWQAAL